MSICEKSNASLVPTRLPRLVLSASSSGFTGDQYWASAQVAVTVLDRCGTRMVTG
jgi:hypothetical protein